MLTRAQQHDSDASIADDGEPTDSDGEREISVHSSDEVVTPLEVPVALAPKVPERFGRYVLLERMGEGGMAEVFRAVIPGAEGFRRHVVLKRILASHASAPTFVEMFAQEARISALLHHPNIVQVFDFGQVDGAYFLAMELLDGWELAAVNRALRKTHAKMPIEVAAHIAHEVLTGLSYAHTLKVQGYQPHIVHRDVSPSNIMCVRAGGVKLLDFGVASASGRLQAPHQIGQRSFCGKLSYSAPEYVMGRGYDERIDLFAVGVILWEMLVGARLFRGRSDRDTMSALLGLPIPPPSTRRPAVPAELDRIVMTALDRDPESRYQSAALMAEDLEQVLSDRRYQPQMLPRLLGHLFGDAANNPAAITAVEELIQGGSTDSAPPVTLPPAPAPERVSGARGIAVLLSSAVAATLVLVGAAALFLFAFPRAPNHAGGAAVVRTELQPARPPPVMPEIHPIILPVLVPHGPSRSAIAPAASASASASSSSSSTVAAEPTVTSHASAGPERRHTSPPLSRRKPARRRMRAAPPDVLETHGGVIDPFTESASRNPRR